MSNDGEKTRRADESGEPEHDDGMTAADSSAAGVARDEDHNAAILNEARRRSRRSFITGAAAALAGYGGWRWLNSRPDADGIPSPFRRAHQFNESLSQAYYDPARLAPTFPREAARMPRVNGDIGLGTEDFDAAAWRLEAVALADSAKEEPIEPTLAVTLEEIKSLPRVEVVTQLKCIEGWSEVVHWAGARLSDFAAKYRLATRSGEAPNHSGRPGDLARYVGLETPDGTYYVGLDIESALHPQTLLCYEMGGHPLTSEHGAPLRLYTPLKYGIKSIKRIGRITFTDTRPFDFWAERGYDWFSGH